MRHAGKNTELYAENHRGMGSLPDGNIVAVGDVRQKKQESQIQKFFFGYGIPDKK